MLLMLNVAIFINSNFAVTDFMLHAAFGEWEIRPVRRPWMARSSHLGIAIG